MTTPDANLLRLLEPTVRPAGVSSPRVEPTPPIERQSFEALLQDAGRMSLEELKSLIAEHEASIDSVNEATETATAHADATGANKQSESSEAGTGDAGGEAASGPVNVLAGLNGVENTSLQQLLLKALTKTGIDSSTAD